MMTRTMEAEIACRLPTAKLFLYSFAAGGQSTLGKSLSHPA
jgi:hypothetical protein